MQFPERDLTNQYISTSYQDVVQRYAAGGSSAGTTTYILDGIGDVIFSIPTASIGRTVLTQDQTISSSLSSSYSNISSLAFVADVALLAETSSFSETSNFAISASYVPSQAQFHVEKGIISGSNFTGLPLYFNIVFLNMFPNTIYNVVVIGEDARIWSISNRTTSSFSINTNSSQPLAGMVMWRAEE